MQKRKKTINHISRFILMSLFMIQSSNIFAQTVDSARYAASSLLAKGDWYKIKVAETGVYKLTYEDLKKMGIANPAKVQVYGYGGWIMDENFSTATYLDDLPKVSMWMNKTPSNFGPGDYILFYARGDIKWAYDSSKGGFVQTQNPYSFDSYYFISETDDTQKLVQSVTSLPAAVGSTTITDFNDYALHEKELVNIVESGREFYGESFRSSTSQTFTLSLPGIVSDSTALVNTSFIANASSGSSSLNIKVGTTDKTVSIAQTTGNYAQASSIFDNIYQTGLTESTPVILTYKQASSSDKNIHLNYIRINYTRKLKPYGGVTLFRSVKRLSQLEYKIAEASSNMLVFDVTDNTTVSQVDATLSGTDLSFTGSNSAAIREYALVDLSKQSTIPTPTLVGKVKNQDLHSKAAAEMIIIVQPLLQKYAEQLARIHKDDSGLETLIVNPDDIFNEFSSGKPDITAYRRFLKMFYDRGTNEKDRPKYLLLFGDGSYDNRFITTEWDANDKSGMLLTYQSADESINQDTSYTTDDYIGFLEDNEGGALGSATLDIGIGRLTARDESIATILVNKISQYIKSQDKGIWQNTVTFFADDAIAATNATSSEMSHITQSDKYANYLNQYYPSIIINKVYEDIYERVTTSSGGRYPDAKRTLLEKINQGTLVLNFVGHGSTTGWTHENTMLYPDFEALANTKLPLWITATCDFSRFDGISTSGGEAALQNSKGGAIALFSTVRVVGISNNDIISSALYRYLFSEENGKALRLGDIMRKAKSNLVGDSNKLRFFILGDPALRLQYPDNTYSVKITEINGEQTSSDQAVKIQALANNKIKGQIVDSTGQIATDFNGTLESLIFDNQQSLKTRGYKRDGETYNTVFPYTDYPNTIFTGKNTISDGQFELSFVTPKDILYTDGLGKMSFYASSSDYTQEASGYFTNYNVNGTDNSAVQENNPPEIVKIYLNDESFKSGGNTNTTPFFYAQVKDDTGLNLSSAIGHNISLLLDGNTSYNLTPSFVNLSLTDSKEGYVHYQLPELAEGSHSLLFTIWDVWNNSQKQELKFNVQSNYQPQIYNFTIGRNPARDNTQFIITSNLPGSNIQIKYEVFSMNGALQWKHEETGLVDGSSLYEYNWDLTTNSGARLKAGVYICRVTISTNGKVETSKSDKLIILAQ